MPTAAHRLPAVRLPATMRNEARSGAFKDGRRVEHHTAHHATISRSHCRPLKAGCTDAHGNGADNRFRVAVYGTADSMSTRTAFGRGSEMGGVSALCHSEACNHRGAGHSPRSDGDWPAVL